MWREYAGCPEECLIVAESLSPVTCAKGLVVTPAVSFIECPGLDFLLVPGGIGSRREVDNQVLVDFIREQGESCRAVLSVCTGSFLLHRAGLLSGRKATTHWNSLERMRSLQDVEVVEERFVHDGSIWSSAGVSAGIDMMLSFIADTAGERTAGMVQFAMEYYPSDLSYGNFPGQVHVPSYLSRRDRGSSPPNSWGVKRESGLEKT